MSLLASILFPVSRRARGGAENPSNPIDSNWWEGGDGANSDAGITVNRRTALTYAAVWRGINLKSGDVGKIPLVVYKSVGNGRDKDKEHKAYRLLRYKPNSEMTAMVFKRTLQAHVDLQGNGYAWIERNGDASPRSIIPLDPTNTWPVRVNGSLIYLTRFTMDGGWKTRSILPENVLHLRGLGFDGLVGYSFIEFGANSLGLGMAAQKYGSKFLSNNARPSAVIEVPTSMSPEAQRTFLAQWEGMHQGIEAAHKTAILTQGAKLHPFAINAKDAQLLETRQFEIREIANWLGIPPHKLGDNSRTAYNSLEQENQSYLDEALDPSLVTWEEECRDKLLTEREKDEESHAIEFQRNALVRANLSERYAAYAVGIVNGILNPNEVRAKENMNPYEGGDEYLRPLNMGTATGGAAVATTEPEEPEPEDDLLPEPLEELPDDRMRPLIVEALRRAVCHIGHYAKREAKQPKQFGDWLAVMRDKNIAAISDTLLPIAVGCKRDAPDFVSRFFSEMHEAINVVYSTEPEARFEAAVAECVTKLETELPTRWADELTKGTDE